MVVFVGVLLCFFCHCSLRRLRLTCIHYYPVYRSHFHFSHFSENWKKSGTISCRYCRCCHRTYDLSSWFPLHQLVWERQSVYRWHYHLRFVERGSRGEQIEAVSHLTLVGQLCWPWHGRLSQQTDRYASMPGLRHSFHRHLDVSSSSDFLDQTHCPCGIEGGSKSQSCVPCLSCENCNCTTGRREKENSSAGSR